MPDVRNLTIEQLETALPHIRESPRDDGVRELIVRRPAADAREVLDAAELPTFRGLPGDRWQPRGRWVSRRGLR